MISDQLTIFINNRSEDCLNIFHELSRQTDIDKTTIFYPECSDHLQIEHKFSNKFNLIRYEPETPAIYGSKEFDRCETPYVCLIDSEVKFGSTQALYNMLVELKTSGKMLTVPDIQIKAKTIADQLTTKGLKYKFKSKLKDRPYSPPYFIFGAIDEVNLPGGFNSSDPIEKQIINLYSIDKDKISYSSESIIIPNPEQHILNYLEII